MMALFKRNSVWYIRFTYRGKQYKKSTETSDKKLAERIYHNLMGKVVEGKWFERLPGEDKTFREMMEKYLKEYSARNKSHSSYVRDKSLKNHLVSFFGDFTLSEITPRRVSEYKSKRREENVAPATLNKELILMSHAFNIAIKEWEWTKENPLNFVSREKVNNQVERWLTFEEEEKLLNASPPWLSEIIVFVLNTGLRRGEVLDLKWEQIDFSRKTMTILVQKNKGKDTLPLNEGAMEILRARAKVRSIKTSFVFISKVGTRIDDANLRKDFILAVKNAGIDKFRFHDLRHTWATRLVQAGVDIYMVAKLGRWRKITMVERYGHHFTESLRPGIECLDRLRTKISPNLGPPCG